MIGLKGAVYVRCLRGTLGVREVFFRSVRLPVILMEEMTSLRVFGPTVAYLL